MKISKKIKKLVYKSFISVSCLLVILTQYLVLVPQKINIYGSTQSIDSQSEWQSGKYEFNEIDTTNSPGDIKLQADLGSWDGVNSPAYFNHNIAAGGAVANTKILKIDNFAYVFRNRTTGAFLRYDISTREWKEMAYVPIQAYEVLDATTNGVDTIWAFATRSGRKHFLKYDIPSNTWSFLDNTPLALTQGATLEYVSGTTNYVYAFQGGGTGFWRYNIALNQWSSQLTVTATCNLYCDLTYDGSRYLYLASNNYNPDRFLRLDTTLTSPTWSTVANFPADTSVNYGSDLVMVGSDFYMMRTGTAYPGTQTLYKYSGSSWTTVKNVPFTGAYGSMVYDSSNSRIMVFGGIGEMAYYYPGTNTWSNATEGPPANAVGMGTTLASDGAGNIYMCRGQSTTTCYKYSISSNSWTTLSAPTPPTLGALGTSLAFTNSKLYAFKGTSSSQIGQYTPGSPGSWLDISPSGSVTALGEGASVVASGSASIFILRGGNTTTFTHFNTGTNAMTAKTVIPEAVYRGSGLVQASDGGLQYIYALVGGNRGKFYRYHETTNGWYELPSLPTGSYYGGGMAYDGVNYIYTLVGGENEVVGRRLYRYSISGNSWQRMADTPGIIRNGGGITYYDSKLYVYQGYGGSMWSYTLPSTTYKTSGSWYSPVYDYTYVSSWDNFTTSDSGSNITYSTRTSADSYSWDDWQDVTGGTINSSPNRYLQIRATLTGDGTSTPTISSITVDYTSDSTAPDVGSLTVIGKASKTSSTTITFGNSYVYTNPYFTWTGVSESETQVVGYYVYWGTSDADPVVSGNYQTNASYVVDSSMVNGSTYKLRIAAKNSSGTTSTPATYFTYVYSGISPSTTAVVADTQDQWDSVGATKSNVYTSGSSWWNQSYSYRQQLTITASSDLQPGTIAKTSIDTSALETAGKVQVDRDDWRIVYWDGTYWKDLNRQYVNATTTYFPLQKGINNGSSDNNYYVYYGNSSESNTPNQLLENSYGNAKWGSALSFDGNDQVQLPAGYTTAFNGKSAMTVEGWFYYFNTASNRWLYGRSAANNTSVGIASSSNYLTYNVTTNANTYNNNGTTYLESGKWYHFALTYDAATGTAKGFVNGRLDYTRTLMSGNISASATQMIGNYASVYHYGFLDEFRISDSVRYTTDFTPSTSPFTTDANTIALYHFDDLTGQSLTDSSANGFNGTLGSAGGADVNDPTWLYAGTASASAEENAPSTPTDTNLTLEPMPEGSWAGNQLTSLPWGARASYPASVVINNELYVLRGATSVAFYKQNLSTGSWTQLTDIPGTTANGTSMVYDGADSIYVTRGPGALTPNFFKYTISTNTWSSSIDQPSSTFTTGAVMTKVGTKIYIMIGSSTTFLSFDTAYESTSDSVDAWATLQLSPYTVSYGSGLVSDGNGNLWSVSGNGMGFAKYTIQTDTWDTTISAPALIPYYIAYSSNNAFYYDGYIYTFTSVDLQTTNETKNYIWRYKISTDKWENLQTTTEFWMYTGAVAYDGSRYAYFINGYGGSSTGNTAVARYDVLANSIFPETPPLPIDKNFSADSELIYHQVYTGTSMAYDNSDTIYYLQGSTATNPTLNYFNKYSISTKKWSVLPNPPCLTAGSITYAQNKIYLVCANNTKKFYSYDPTTAEWSNLPDAINNINNAGTQIIAYDGTNALYVLQGGSTTNLLKYTIGGSWEVESAVIPGALGTTFGASITTDGSDYLYITRGSGNANFYRYKFTATKGWTTLTSVPENISYGSGSVLHNGKIYLTTGYYNSGMYVYDITTGSWQKAPLAQSPIYAGGAMVKGSGNSLYVLQGYYFFTFWKYNIPSSSSSYKYSGTYTSNVINLGDPYDLTGLSATVASPSATTISFETRTSTDSANWDSWVSASDLKQYSDNTYLYHINSDTKQYIQVKVNMTSDESAASPNVSNLSIVYHADSVAPTNPDTLLSYETATKAAEILTNTWYNKSTPYFEWSGGSDATGSGVLGYYVYFGTNSGADASISGTFQTEASYSASLATDGTDDGEYYLKIKAKDNAGNIASSHWSPFHYRYDKTAPTEVGTITVSPRIYSATNDFDFSWDAITDVTSNATSSGLLGYYYQASSSANIINDIATTEASVSGVLAYIEGTNTFNVKAKDNAGNETAYKTASFYYNITPPSAPINLEDITSPTDAGANEYSFTWDDPPDIKGSVSEFRYTINEVPDADNYTSTENHTVAGINGTQSGANTFYIVAVDEAGNVDYDNYASIEFEVDITAPGTPLNPEVFDNSIRSSEQYQIGITWDKPTELGSAFDEYRIYASTEDIECSSSMSSYSEAGSTAGTSTGGSYVVQSIDGEALESTTYYICVKACSSSNQCSSPSSTMSMLPTGRWLAAPDLTDEPEVTAKTKSATVTWTTSRASNSFVKYGTSSGSYGDEVGSSDQEISHSVGLSNLAPGTKYYYKVLWTDEDGNQGESSEYTFTTVAAPSVANVKFSNININSTYVTFTIKNAVKASVQYGKTLSYGGTESISTSTSESTYTIAVASLTEGTLYHLRVAAEDAEGNLYYSDDYTFETLPTPKITGLKVQQVAGMPTATLRVIWTTNTLVSSIITYYPTSSPSKAIDQISLALKKNHEMVIKNLSDATDYTFDIKGKDSAGNEATTITRKLKTSTDIRAPEIQNLNVESTIIGVGETAKAQITVTWDTDEPGTTQVEYAQGTGTTYNQTTQEDSNLTTNHTVTITGLTPAKIYHLRALSKDKSNNLAQSFDTVIITPKSTKDALNLVIENLSSTFGFLNNLKGSK